MVAFICSWLVCSKVKIKLENESLLLHFCWIICIYIKHQLGQKTSYTAFYTCNKCLNITFYRLSIFRVSQHFFDPYSFCHILHGFIFYGLWGWWPELVWGYNWWWVWLLGAVLAVLGELVHELIENSDYNSVSLIALQLQVLISPLLHLKKCNTY